MVEVELLRALASDKRILVLEWLRDPEAHFPPQADGDLVREGVCSLAIAQKLGVSRVACAQHLRVLHEAGLIRGKKTKRWVFYQRDDDRIAQVKQQFARDW